MIEVVKEDDDVLEVALKGENPGLANLVAERLLESKGVSFAASKVDHPLFGNPHLVIKAKDPRKELKKALEELADEFKALQKEVKKPSKK
ncbi:MAG: DNA-directed RNA polymerase subunit L [Candidatus Micrarchaeota archaeon]